MSLNDNSLKPLEFQINNPFKRRAPSIAHYQLFIARRRARAPRNFRRRGTLSHLQNTSREFPAERIINFIRAEDENSITRPGRAVCARCSNFSRAIPGRFIKQQLAVDLQRARPPQLLFMSGWARRRRPDVD